MPTINVPVTKSKGVVEIDTDAIPTEVYAEALALGLKTLVNRGTSKITKTTYPEEAELAAAAQAKAEEQVKAIMSGNIKFSGSKAKSKLGGAVMTEARRLAKNLVKDAMKAKKIKISTVPASEITRAANHILEGEQGPAILDMAKQNLAEREATKLTVDISTLVQPDAKLVAKEEARKKDKPLSAKQAGKVAPRAKKAKATAQPTA